MIHDYTPFFRPSFCLSVADYLRHTLPSAFLHLHGPLDFTVQWCTLACIYLRILLYIYINIVGITEGYANMLHAQCPLWYFLLFLSFRRSLASILTALHILCYIGSFPTLQHLSVASRTHRGQMRIHFLLCYFPCAYKVSRGYYCEQDQVCFEAPHLFRF